MPLGKVDRKRLQEQIAEDEAARERGNAFFTPKDGKNYIRVLPPGPDSEVVFVKSGTHWGIGPNKKIFNCPAVPDKNADCFLCDEARRLLDSDDEDDKAVGDAIRAKKSWLYNIVDLKDVEAGIQVAAFGVTVHNDILAYLKDEDDQYGDITDPDEGTDLIVSRSGTGFKTKYDVRAKTSRTPLPDEILDLLETEDPADLTKARPASSSADMKAAYEGTIDEEEEEEEETPVVRRKSAAGKKTKPVVVDEDEEDEDDDDKPAPKKGKASAKKTKPVVVDDDDDDDDEDEEDEEEAPKSSRTAKRSFGSRLKGRSR